MELKQTPQGALIYMVMILHLLAFVLTVARRPRAGWMAYAAGCGVACASVGYRWWHVGHAPLQSMFEVFLIMAMLMFPISLLCRKLWKVDGQQWDMLITVLLLFPAGFTSDAAPKKLMPSLQSPLFIPHVTAYMIAYVLMAKATIGAVRQLAVGRSDERMAGIEFGSYKVARLGLVVLTTGLVLGAWWGKIVWTHYWNWDPKEMWSLATWLIYLAYFHFRALNGRRYPRVNAAFLILGMVAIIYTLLVVTYLLRSVHSYAS